MAITDNYLHCESYSAAPDSEKYPGFKSWFDEAASHWYFAVITNTGRVVLRSEGYTTEAARDNGIESVMRNRDIEARYSTVEEEGKWYVILKAGNHQEIARSCAYETEAAVLAGIAACFSTFAEAEAMAEKFSNVEEYQPCEYYGNRAASDKYPGFHSWKDEELGQSYFALTDKAGDILLRSEGYNTDSSRDNGIESVLRNRDIEARYSLIEEEGLWYVSLKAGNHQEIARSCGYESEALASAGMAKCASTYSEKTASTAAVEDYLACEAYTGHAAHEKHGGFTSFTSAEDGLHYFAMVDGHQGVVLRSEGYTTTTARDNGIESVLRNRDNEDRYTIVQDETDGQWYVCLKAGNHQEIARSCGFADRAAAEGHLFHCYSKQQLERIATGEGQIIEDYLPCKAYEGHPASAFEGFTIFQDTDTGLHYFAMLDDNGKVVLKSEGYKDPKRRDNGIESVIRNRGIKDHWREMEDEHGHYMSLRAVNHQEIARSCHDKDKVAMLAWFAPLIAGHKSWTGDAEPEEKVSVAAPLAAAAAVAAAAAAIPPPAPKKVVTTEKIAPAPIVTQTVAPEAAAGGSWWKWLLPLLLLGALLFWWLNRESCAKKPEVPAVTAPAPIPTPAPSETPAAPAPAPAPTCNCTGNADALFNTGVGTPKSLRRLGTNPEFGDSHGLTPEQFFKKISDRAKANPVDQRFLDRVYKGMGYKGFADATAAQFSAVELAPGTVGNIGYSKMHKTLYAKLDTEGKDLLAFRIKSANGCDMHFMKTCGNHFFTCPK